MVGNGGFSWDGCALLWTRNWARSSGGNISSWSLEGCGVGIWVELL